MRQEKGRLLSLKKTQYLLIITCRKEIIAQELWRSMAQPQNFYQDDTSLSVVSPARSRSRRYYVHGGSLR